eukprot:CAMPEP_0119505372 /NCGR_PEP_ID=MMETSP1344-20130328/25937_1 /TAXON_ID=236787 /ORGANISM="Florenciella parvula, Strain CCMP2471" /LENGTH=101 /DNA_ID=CAMNT_0007541821 /DNA_START=25 /DNA_END=327 /DNA_ORIENTATION=+
MPSKQSSEAHDRLSFLFSAIENAEALPVRARPEGLKSASGKRSMPDEPGAHGGRRPGTWSADRMLSTPRFPGDGGAALINDPSEISTVRSAKRQKQNHTPS